MRLKNVLIVVKDIERSRQFYHDVFGLQLVLDHGGISQLGSPAELSRQEGLYREIENIQSMNAEEVNAV